MLRANPGHRSLAGTGPPRLVRTLGRHRWLVLDDFVRAGVALLQLVVPGAVAVVDHHGLERVPTHLHAAALVGPEQRHAHGFETLHEHVASAKPVASTEPVTLELEPRWSWAQTAMISPSSPVGALLVFALQAALAALALGVLIARPLGRVERRGRRPAEHPPGPPAQPPRPALLSTGRC